MTEGINMLVDKSFFELMFSYIDGCEWSNLSRAFAPQASYARPGYLELKGFDAIHTFYVRDRIILSGRHTIEGCVVDGDDASCWGVFEGVSRDGVPLAERFADTYRLCNGLIVHRRTHFFRPAI